MSATFGTNNGATVKQWTARIFKEALYENPLLGFMGQSAASPIVLISELENLNGDKAVVHMVPNLDPDDAITGDGQLTGNEEDVSQYVDTLTVTQIKKGVAVREFSMSQQRVRLKLKEEQYRLLKNFEMERLRNDILVALTDVTEGRTQARYLYGALDSNWNATHATALGNVDASDDKLTLEMIDKAVTKAKSKGLRKMNPARVGTQKGFPVEGFVFLGRIECIRDLKRDPEFRNQIVYNDRLKGSDGVFNGAFYVGTYAGTHIFEMPDPQNKLLVEGAGAASIDLGHNLLLGAQAAQVGYAMRPTIREQMDDYDERHGVGLIQIRGQKKMVFGGEDWGVVHVFAAAAADA